MNHTFNSSIPEVEPGDQKFKVISSNILTLKPEISMDLENCVVRKTQLLSLFSSFNLSYLSKWLTLFYNSVIIIIVIIIIITIGCDGGSCSSSIPEKSIKTVPSWVVWHHDKKENRICKMCFGEIVIAQYGNCL